MSICNKSLVILLAPDMAEFQCLSMSLHLLWIQPKLASFQYDKSYLDLRLRILLMRSFLNMADQGAAILLIVGRTKMSVSAMHTIETLRPKFGQKSVF